MAKRYEFSAEEILEIEKARSANKDKRREARLKALGLRTKDATDKQVTEQTVFFPSTVIRLVSKYRKNRIEVIFRNHYGGNHCKKSVEEQAAILVPFREKAEKGEIIGVKEIETTYQAAVDHLINVGQIYYVLHRHGWRKVMPRSRHPKKADDTTIEV